MPLLGDIPWIGQLFRSESKSRQKTNLMVFLRPVIIRDGDTADAITANRYDYVQGVQGAYKSDNRLIYDKDDPVVPPMPEGPRQGASADMNLFNLDAMRRQQLQVVPVNPSQPAQPVQRLQSDSPAAVTSPVPSGANGTATATGTGASQ